VKTSNLRGRSKVRRTYIRGQISQEIESERKKERRYMEIKQQVQSDKG
jgi:hypothetical protein